MSGKDEEILGVWSELFVGSAFAVRAVESRMAGKAPLSVDEYDVMLCISRSPDQSIRFSALAEAATYTKSGITRIMKRLQAEGFVVRKECPDDRRGSLAELTAEGRKALKDTWRHYRTAILETLSPSFTAQEAKTLRELLGRIVDEFSTPALVQIRSPKLVRPPGL